MDKPGDKERRSTSPNRDGKGQGGPSPGRERKGRNKAHHQRKKSRDKGSPKKWSPKKWSPKKRSPHGKRRWSHGNRAPRLTKTRNVSVDDDGYIVVPLSIQPGDHPKVNGLSRRLCPRSDCAPEDTSAMHVHLPQQLHALLRKRGFSVKFDPNEVSLKDGVLRAKQSVLNNIKDDRCTLSVSLVWPDITGDTFTKLVPTNESFTLENVPVYSPHSHEPIKYECLQPQQPA